MSLYRHAVPSHIGKNHACLGVFSLGDLKNVALLFGLSAATAAFPCVFCNMGKKDFALGMEGGREREREREKEKERESRKDKG